MALPTARLDWIFFFFDLLSISRFEKRARTGFYFGSALQAKVS